LAELALAKRAAANAHANAERAAAEYTAAEQTAALARSDYERATEEARGLGILAQKAYAAARQDVVYAAWSLGVQKRNLTGETIPYRTAVGACGSLRLSTRAAHKFRVDAAATVGGKTGEFLKARGFVDTALQALAAAKRAVAASRAAATATAARTDAECLAAKSRSEAANARAAAARADSERAAALAERASALARDCAERAAATLSFVALATAVTVTSVPSPAACAESKSESKEVKSGAPVEDNVPLITVSTSCAFYDWVRRTPTKGLGVEGHQYWNKWRRDRDRQPTVPLPIVLQKTMPLSASAAAAASA